jgi:hypothetical protein
MRAWTKRAFFGETRPFFLLAVLAPPIAGAAWLLLAPPAVLSREMTWDLLFNLEGAWSLWNGLQLHIDVHDPLGIVTFGLTALGFNIGGVGPRAILIGEAIYASLMLAAALCVIPRRLPPAAAAIATLYVVLLVLVPINFGDSPEIYSFAMSYNRFGWSALILLFIVLFVAPRHKNIAWLDQAVAFFLTALLFYLKITYFVVAIVGIAAAPLLATHVRRRAFAWLGVLAALALLTAAPVNATYWRDILAALRTGAMRVDIISQIKQVIVSRDTSIVGVELVALLCLWRAGVSLDRFLRALFIIACGAIILSQNEQSDGIAIYVVIALLLYDSAQGVLERPIRRPKPEASLLLGAVLIAPALGVATMGASLVGYYKAATLERDVIADTNLRGLAVPPERTDLITLFSGSRLSPAMLNAARLDHPRYELTQAEYVRTILEAAGIVRELMAARGAPRRPYVEVLDTVNPLPFMLGLAPPRGRELWFDRAFPWPPAEQFLARTDYVFVPKFPTDSESARMALRHYGSYLAQNFSRIETDSWIVFQRQEDLNPLARGTVAGTFNHPEY